MDVWNLEQVRAVHRCGSFAKAADALGVSLPSLSKSIARLEDELKVKIFERTASGAVLTPVGELIAARAQRILGQTHELAREAELLAGGDAGTVRISLAPGWRAFLAPIFFSRLVQAYPRLRLELIVGERSRALADLQANELDLAFLAGGPDLAESGLIVRTLAEEPIWALASPAHPLAGRGQISRREFAEYRCVGSYSGHVSVEALRLVDDGAAPAGAYKTNDFDLLMPLVLDGVATLLAPLPAAYDALVTRRLVPLDIDIGARLAIVAVTSRASSGSPMVQRAIALAETFLDEISAKIDRFLAAA